MGRPLALALALGLCALRAAAAAGVGAAGAAVGASAPPRQSPAPLPPPRPGVCRRPAHAAAPPDPAAHVQPTRRPRPAAPTPAPAGRMRLTALGTGVPRAMRRQYCTSYLLQLGDGRSFLFDIGDVSRAGWYQAGRAQEAVAGSRRARRRPLGLRASGGATPHPKPRCCAHPSFFNRTPRPAGRADKPHPGGAGDVGQRRGRRLRVGGCGGTGGCEGGSRAERRQGPCQAPLPPPTAHALWLTALPPPTHSCF
jgi:hypothetical protein